MADGADAIGALFLFLGILMFFDRSLYVFYLYSTAETVLIDDTTDSPWEMYTMALLLTPLNPN